MSPSDRDGKPSYVSVFRTPTSGKLTLTILSAKLETWPTHWDGERNQFCLRAIHRACRFCSTGQRQRWEWYALAMPFPSREVGIGVITGGAFAHCSDLQDRKDQTRGLVVYLERIGSAKSAVKVRVDERRVSEDKLPGLSFTVKDALWQLWKVAELLELLDQAEAEKQTAELLDQAEAKMADPQRAGPTIDNSAVQDIERPGGSHPQRRAGQLNGLMNGYHTTD